MAGEMKKAFIMCVILVILILVSCDNPHDITVINNSSNQVTYTMYGRSDVFIIAPGEIQSFMETRTEPVSFSGNPHPVKCSRIDSYSVEFVDAERIDMYVANTLPFAVKLYANGYIENSDGTKGPLTILANKEATAFIYTKNPKFTFDVTTYSIDESHEIENNVMYVKLK
jgi:hypothetical protein